MAGEKTEKATPKRREEQRKKGNVFQGKDITISINLLIMFVSLKLLGKYIYEFLQRTMAFFLAGSGNVKFLDSGSITKLLINILGRILVLVLPLLLISALTSFLLSGAQTRFIFSTKKIAFKLSNLNPLNGFKRTFSLRAIMQLVKSMLIIVVISIMVYDSIVEFSKNISSLYFVPIQQSIFFIASSVFSIFIRVCIVVLMIGILDFFFQWWQHEQDIKMTKQEIKEEYKQIEGDPHIKSAIKSRQQQMSRRRIMQRVPEADVIIVNPEHFAVALKYDSKANRAPMVIAKGKNYLALKIKAIAAENDIKIEENPPLARALYKAVDIDKEIPPEFYQAVAEVLSYVYSLNKKK